jgi:flagellar protein FlaF
MSNSAASAYARVATTTASPRDIEAQTLLKAANKLQDAVNNADPLSDQTMQALMFNRKLWTIFLSEAMRDDNNPQPLEVRQKIANISVFVLSQTAALQMSPQFDHFRPLIEINRNIAAGLAGRP